MTTLSKAIKQANWKRVGGLVLASTLVIGGCSSDSQDTGSSSSREISGAAYDGYIAFGNIFHDTNNNGKLEAYEPRAVTDADGYFTVSKDGLTNYCELPSSDILSQHCFDAASPGGVFRIVGGYDLFTGQPFTGSLVLDDTSGSSSAEVGVISPVTTLLAQVPEDERDDLLSDLGITAEEAAADILNEATVNSATFGRIYQIHKVASALEDFLTDTYDEIGDEDFPLSFSDIIYNRIAEVIAAGGSLDDLSSSEATLRANIIADIEAIYAEADVTPPTAPANLNTILGQTDDIADMVNDLFITPNEDNNLNVTRGAARAVEVVVEKVMEGDSDTEIQNAIDAATGTGVENDEYIAALESDDIDFLGLVQDTFGDVGALDDTADISGADDFTAAVGNMLTFSDSEPDLTAAIDIYFEGEPSATTGDMTMCITFDEADSDEFDVNGEHVAGTWTVLPGTTNSVLLTFELLGDRQVILTSRGSNNYNFIFAGNEGDYTSGTGLTTIVGDVPANDDDCGQGSEEILF